MVQIDNFDIYSFRIVRNNHLMESQDQPNIIMQMILENVILILLYKFRFVNFSLTLAYTNLNIDDNDKVQNREMNTKEY